MTSHLFRALFLRTFRQLKDLKRLGCDSHISYRQTRCSSESDPIPVASGLLEGEWGGGVVTGFSFLNFF